MRIVPTCVMPAPCHRMRVCCLARCSSPTSPCCAHCCYRSAGSVRLEHVYPLLRRTRGGRLRALHAAARLQAAWSFSHRIASRRVAPHVASHDDDVNVIIWPEALPIAIAAHCVAYDLCARSCKPFVVYSARRLGLWLASFQLCARLYPAPYLAPTNLKAAAAYLPRALRLRP